MIKGADLSRVSTTDTVYADLRVFCCEAVADSRLATERELAKRYGLSQTSVRRVLDRLQEEGLIYKKYKRGTFVSGAAGQDREQKTILFLDDTGHLDNPFFSYRLKGAISAAESLNLRLQVLDLYTSFSDQMKEDLRQNRIVGVIVPWLPKWLYEKFKRFNPLIKVVALNHARDLQDTASVTIDFFEGGRILLAHAAERARKIKVVFRQPEFGAGVTCEHSLLANREEVAVEQICLPEDARVDDRIDEVLAGNPDALVFNEDRDARRVIDLIVSRDAGLLKGLAFYAIMNRDVELLPTFVRGLEVDGTYLGKVAIQMLKQMIEGRLDQAGTHIKVNPLPTERA